MVKLLQNFDTFELRQKQDAPYGSLPPAFWKETSGRAIFEQIWPRAAVTLNAKVRIPSSFREKATQNSKRGVCGFT